MGKPFYKELLNINNTFDWASKIDITKLYDKIKILDSRELIAVGSGGSLSACYYAALLHFSKGFMAKAVTPLDLHQIGYSINNYSVLFISAGGRNKDILLGHKAAANYEAKSILNFCMRTNTPLAKLSTNYEYSNTIELDIPTKKDGFLASNSLLAYFVLLYRLYGNNIDGRSIDISPETIDNIKEYAATIDINGTITVLYGSYSQPVAIDIESKFSEAALGNILLCDYRNFGHGRHNWYAKRGNNSSIVALITPENEKLAEKTLSEIPDEIPVLKIKANANSYFSSIELLVKSFYLVNELGLKNNIDPGRPGVPPFGSKLYNLNYVSTLRKRTKKTEHILKRKTKLNRSIVSTTEEKVEEEYEKELEVFLSKLQQAKFGSIICDFDGTLCSSEERLIGMGKKITNELIRLLKGGVIIGVVTGRGQSVRQDLQKKIPQKYWKQIIVGYYNGSDIGELKDNTLPDKTKQTSKSLTRVQSILTSYFGGKIDVEVRPAQLTIEINNSNIDYNIKEVVRELVIQNGLNNIEVLESSHSIDIVDRKLGSKLNILPYCEELALSLGRSKSCLCIGDKGRWPGNDYQLLATPYSLSVDEVSLNKNSCWNLTDPGLRNIEATLEYLSCLKVEENAIIFKYS